MDPDLAELLKNQAAAIAKFVEAFENFCEQNNKVVRAVEELREHAPNLFTQEIDIDRNEYAIPQYDLEMPKVDLPRFASFINHADGDPHRP